MGGAFKVLRDGTKKIRIGDVVIGGGNPVVIQSMTNTRTEDVAATVAQIRKLEAAGCEIIRCAVPTMEAAAALEEIKKQIDIIWEDMPHIAKPNIAKCAFNNDSNLLGALYNFMQVYHLI